MSVPRNIVGSVTSVRMPIRVGVSMTLAGIAPPDTVYLDDDGTQWIKTGTGPYDWVRAGTRPRPPAPWPPPDGEAAVARTWPHVLVARFRALGHREDQALDLAEDRLRQLRRGDPPRDVLGSAPFSAGLGIRAELAQTLDRMFVETNFMNVDDEWAWKNLFEAAVYDLPSPR